MSRLSGPTLVPLAGSPLHKHPLKLKIIGGFYHDTKRGKTILTYSFFIKVVPY